MTTILNIRIVKRKGWLTKNFFIYINDYIYYFYFRFFNFSFKDASLSSENERVETN